MTNHNLKKALNLSLDVSDELVKQNKELKKLVKGLLKLNSNICINFGKHFCLGSRAVVNDLECKLCKRATKLLKGD